MTALVIKNLPDDVLARLKDRAKANHRSLTKEAIVLLTYGVAQESPMPHVREALAQPYVLPGNPMTADKIEDAIRAHPDDAWPQPDGREALRASLIKQPDGSYINVLGIDDESFFKTLESVRSEFRVPDLPDFGDESP